MEFDNLLGIKNYFPQQKFNTLCHQQQSNGWKNLLSGCVRAVSILSLFGIGEMPLSALFACFVLLSSSSSSSCTLNGRSCFRLDIIVEGAQQLNSICNEFQSHTVDIDVSITKKTANFVILHYWINALHY